MAIVNLDRVVGLGVESVQINDVLQNGYWLQLGGVVAGNPDLRVGTKPTDITKGGLVLHATPEVDPNPFTSGLDTFKTVANKPVRAYRLAVGDLIQLTADLFTATPVVGDVVAPKVGSYLLQTSLGTETVQLKVLQATTLGYKNAPAFLLEVVKG